MRLYDLDFYSWTRETADNLRRADFDSIDAAAVADEIEDTGRRERRALERRVAVLMRTC